MMNKTFLHFFFGFLAIVAAAFGVLAYAGSQPQPIDNVALPR
jgi:hypothetical protein